MNKRGVTIIELLAALVLLGIVISLTAMIFSVINRASNNIELTSRANSQALIIDQTIKDGLSEFGATDFSQCGTDCITFEQHFTFYHNETLDEIQTVYHLPALKHRIEISGDVLLINGASLYTSDFTLGPNSYITINSVNNPTIIVTISLDLTAENGDIFNFKTTYSFKVSPIPPQ